MAKKSIPAGASHWNREGDPFSRQFVSSGNHSPADIARDGKMWRELRSVVERELDFMNENHLARLRVVIELCH